MKFRTRKQERFGSKFNNIECFYDGSWLSVCSTVVEDKKLAGKLKEACEKAAEEGMKFWFNK